MRATLMYGAGDVRVEDVPDSEIEQPTDALVRITASCVCGSDLHPYGSMSPDEAPAHMGHEFIGIVEATGADVATLHKGDLVVAPFAYSDGTGYHAAVAGGVKAGSTVTVIGDGAVGLLAVLSAKRLGADQIILMGRHTARTDLGREFGATDVVDSRGDEGVNAVRDLTGGHGTHVVLEAVGHMPAYEQAYGVVRPGGTISRVGVPQYEDAPVGFTSLFGDNITLTGGPAPSRAYMDELLPPILDGTIDPSKVFDVVTNLDGAPRAYQDMADRKALKVLLKP